MRLQHGRVAIELHRLKSGEGRPLLLLHALGASAGSWPAEILAWPHGPVHALDFAGHGQSGSARGGAYYPEYFLADADLALEYIAEPCVLVGAGVGAYVALLLAGSRSDQILAALLLEGAGLEGGGALPGSGIDAEGIEGFEKFIETASRDFLARTDPFVAQCARDLRPLEYVTSFAQAAKPMLFSACVGDEVVAPSWWRTAFEHNRGMTAPPDIIDCLDELDSMATSRS